MCPFFLLTFIFSILLLLVEFTTALMSVTFSPASLNQLHEGDTRVVNFTIHFNSTLKSEQVRGSYRINVDRPDVADVLDRKDFEITEQDITNNGKKFDGSFQVKANFLGYSRMDIQKKQSYDGIKVFDSLYDNDTLRKQSELVVSVVRDKDLLQKIFIYSVAIVVSVSYINMGCALDMGEVYQVLRRPVAPAIGFFSQYFCMPLLSFLLGAILFDETYLKLGLFVFGCSPGGGASNMWAVLLGGNLNLSITMTFLSTFLSFGMLPFWLYTLGRTIFEETATTPPSRSIFTTLGSMLIFLGIGLLIKRYVPKLANVCRRILAPFSVAMIVFIIIFGTYTNLYMFKVMTWRILLATAANVWTGMALGYGLAFIFGKPLEDLIAIAIETGIQNTGVSIVLLGLSLPQPDADLASAVPVAASIMTPIPLTIAYICIKIHKCYFSKKHMSILSTESFEKEQLKNGKPIPNTDSNMTVVDLNGDNEFDYGSNCNTKASNCNLVKA